MWTVEEDTARWVHLEARVEVGELERVLDRLSELLLGGLEATYVGQLDRRHFDNGIAERVRVRVLEGGAEVVHCDLHLVDDCHVDLVEAPSDAENRDLGAE